MSFTCATGLRVEQAVRAVITKRARVRYRKRSSVRVLLKDEPGERKGRRNGKGERDMGFAEGRARGSPAWASFVSEAGSSRVLPSDETAPTRLVGVLEDSSDCRSLSIKKDSRHRFLARSGLPAGTSALA